MIFIQKFYSLTYHDANQSTMVGIIEHNSKANREYIYMLSPQPSLDAVVGQDYLTNLYHFAWILNVLNDHHLTPQKFGITDPLDWLSAHPAKTANTLLAIDDHFRVSPMKTTDKDNLSSLYENKVSHKRRKMLSNFDVR
ncbi:hypothetical protein HGK75_05305 [uncultured bacterium]|nr:hypothetical protein HGK75_05305 [uncultured bacterium]